jgi:hypothetical protein
MNEWLPSIEVETADARRFSVIWLHELGADGFAVEKAFLNGAHHVN